MNLSSRPSSRPSRRLAVGGSTIFLLALTALSAAGTGPASAHTETDVVAVPAGSEATITLRPTHGCGDSPTIEVAIRTPVSGATADDVAGWTATTTPDGTDRSVLTWSGGSLPPDAKGAFPVTFAVPDTPGELLTFPAVQTCADGAELAWISGDPEAENPAPRLLVLPAGSSPAATIDDVAPDAPGRDLLTAIVDVDNPAATTTVVPPATTEAPASAAATTTPGDETAAGASDNADAGSDDDDGSVVVPVLISLAVAVAVVGGAVALLRRRG